MAKKKKVDEEIGIRRIEVTEGALEIEMTPSQTIVANLVLAFRDQLQDAKNYVEMSLRHPGDGTYTVTITRPQGKTPHQLLQEAQSRITLLERELQDLKVILSR
jgi:hypothetical protein